MASHANPVNWFEIPVSDLGRAKVFYEAILELELTESEMGPSKMAWFPMEMGGAGSAGTLILADGYTPSLEGTVVYLNVDAIDATLKKIEPAGGKVLMPRMDIGQHGFVAHFKDTEGNRVALHEYPVNSENCG